MTIQDKINCPFLKIDKSWYYLTRPSNDDVYFVMGEGVKDFKGDLLEYTSRKSQRRLIRIRYGYRNMKIKY